MRPTNSAICLALLVLIGCGGSRGDDPAIRRLSSSEADQLSAERSRFQTDKDPPLTAQTHFAAGQLAESQGAVPVAIEQYRQAVRLDPGHQGALYRLGVIYTQARDLPRAIEAWKQYVRATAGSATALSNLAFCYDVAGQSSRAEETYRAGIQRDPSNQPCRVNLGLMLARQGRRAEAIEQLAAVLKPAEVHYNLASVYEQQGRTDAARHEYEKALKLDPQLWEARSRLSKID